MTFPETVEQPDKDFFQFQRSDRVNVFDGDALTVLRTLEAGSYKTCITSPPYYAQRDYGIDGQLGLEQTPQEFVNKLVEVFAEVKRVLADDGSLWVNIADSYARDKNLLGIPWRLALALQDDGWTLRQDIIWSKPNPMPEPAKDRCARSHEYIFFLTKGPKYAFDSHAIRERGTTTVPGSPTTRNTKETHGSLSGGNTGLNALKAKMAAELAANGFIMRNKRSVWNVQIRPSREGHFATYPEELVEPCILATTKKDEKVLDPFGGSGTTGIVAKRLGRYCDLIEINPKYADIARNRTA